MRIRRSGAERRPPLTFDLSRKLSDSPRARTRCEETLTGFGSFSIETGLIADDSK